jgi:hypothetical protein
MVISLKGAPYYKNGRNILSYLIVVNAPLVCLKNAC